MWTYNYNYQNLSDDELMHYGVIGMRWGARRAARRNTAVQTLKFKRKMAKGTKNYDSADRKYQAAVRRARAKAVSKKYGISEKEADKQVNESFRKAYGKNYVFGTYGAAKYNEARAAGKGRLESGIRGTLATYGNAATLGGLGLAEGHIKKKRARRSRGEY